MARTIALKLAVTVAAAIVLLLSPPVQHQLARIEIQAATQAMARGETGAAEALVARVEARTARYGWDDLRLFVLELHGMLAMQQKRPAEAHACYQQIVEATPPPEAPRLAGAWYDLGLTALQLGNAREAVVDFERGMQVAERRHIAIASSVREGYAAALAAAGRTADADRQRLQAALDAKREAEEEDL